WYIFLYCVFFFQAEDGIRDRNVTGVQTCALPIWTFSIARRWRTICSSRLGSLAWGQRRVAAKRPAPAATSTAAAQPTPASQRGRSEERRVGKECRWRRSRWPEQDKE